MPGKDGLTSGILAQAEQPTFKEVVEWLSACISLPTDVEAKARLLLLDTFGCLVSGLRHEQVKAYAQALSAVFPGETAWPGSPHKLGPAGLAALGAAAACWDEACEGNSAAHGRPGLPVVPTVLALASQSDAALDEVLLALVTGYEIGVRAGELWRIPNGWHVDGSWHSLGVAAATARLFSGPDTIQAAIEISACQIPASLYLPITQGSVARNTYPSHAVLLGILSANAAKAGFQAPVGALTEARHRVLRADKDGQFASSGVWTILDGYLKPYAGVRHTHYAVEAALRVRRHSEFSHDKIKSIKLRTYSEAVQYCGNRAPETIIQAQFSLSYAVAAALVFGDLGLDAYDDIGRDDVRRIEQLIEIEVEPQRSTRGAFLSVNVGALKLTAAVDAVLGDASLPLTEEHVVKKFIHYAEPAVGKSAAQAVARFIVHGHLNELAKKCFQLAAR